MNIYCDAKKGRVREWMELPKKIASISSRLMNAFTTLSQNALKSRTSGLNNGIHDTVCRNTSHIYYLRTTVRSIQPRRLLFLLNYEN